MSFMSVYPPTAGPGDVVTVRFPTGSVVDLSRLQMLYFSPQQLPPGIPSIGAGGIAAFGYVQPFTVVDAETLIITVSQLGTNALSGPLGGAYGIVLVFDTGYLIAGTLLLLPPGAPVPRPAGAWFTDLHLPFIPVGCYVPPNWTYWYDSPSHPCDDRAYWSVAANWPNGDWHWAPLPPPPRGWREVTSAQHGLVIEATPGWGAPGSPPPGPPGWPPWQRPPVPSAAAAASVILPPPLPHAPLPAPPAAPPPASTAAGAGISGWSPVVVQQRLAAAAAGPAPEPTLEPRPPEAVVAWLAEVMTPLRPASDPGPNQVQLPHLSEPVTIEKPTPDSPPITRYGMIISAQLMTPDLQPIVNERVTLQFIRETDVADDDSFIQEVSDKLDDLNLKLKGGVDGTGQDYAYTDAEGKVYCWYEQALVDRDTIPRNLFLKGIRAIIGENTQPAPTPPVTLAGSAVSNLVSGETDSTNVKVDGIAEKLWDIFVEPAKKQVITAVVFTAGKLHEAHAALKRTKQDVIGFGLKRVADAVIVQNVQGAALAMATGNIREEERAVVIGALLGIPRGLWVMGRDQLNDLENLTQTVAIDLPRAMYNFFSKDLTLKLEILGAVVSPQNGLTYYALDGDFRNAIDGGLARFKLTLAKLSDKLKEVEKYLTSSFDPLGASIAVATTAQQAKNFFESAGKLFYNSFADYVGFIATDYLAYEKDKFHYHCFVGAFIAGDFAGYILGTVLVQLLFDLLSSGLATVLAVIGKLARAAQLGKYVEKLVLIFKKLWSALQKLANFVKSCIGDVLIYMMKLLSELDEALFGRAFQGLFHEIEPGIRMLFHYGETDSGARLSGIAEGLAEGFARSAEEEEAVESAMRLLAEMAEWGEEERFLCRC